MEIRDFKPTRLAATVEMLVKLIRIMRDTTPLCKFMIARVEN